MNNRTPLDLLTPLTPTALPRHVAIIMDGNGRWAEGRGLKRLKGHHEGVLSARRAVQSCLDLGIPYLTLYAFSTENWRRPAEEVSGIMGLFRAQLTTGLQDLVDRNIRIRIIGRRDDLDQDLRHILETAETKTATNTALVLTIAFNYGARDEIVRAAQKWGRDLLNGHGGVDALTEDTFAQYLDTAGIPDPDLFLRTSGEYRISNYLLWQLAYAELVILDCFWPDFNHDHMTEALARYARRNRRFGDIAPPPMATERPTP